MIVRHVLPLRTQLYLHMFDPAILAFFYVRVLY
jgi:hypothetical protein